MSLQELDLLDSSNTIYKLVGPVLVKQDLDEAKATVGKRLDYINGEMWVPKAVVQLVNFYPSLQTGRWWMVDSGVMSEETRKDFACYT